MHRCSAANAESSRRLQCTQDILDQIPATADQVFQAVQPVIERLAAVPPMGFAAMASMRELTVSTSAAFVHSPYLCPRKDVFPHSCCCLRMRSFPTW